MSASPPYPDPEKSEGSSNEKKVAYSSDLAVYTGDGAAEETDAVEFGEVKELR